jgi:hypothetical protein
MMNTGKEYTLDEIGVLAPVKTPVSRPRFQTNTVYMLCSQIDTLVTHHW